MSVYYNLTLNNDNQQNQIFVMNQNAFQPILEKQSDYQVGIKRFKIPSQTIDFYRIYPNRQVLGVLMNTYNSGSQNYSVVQLGSQYQQYKNQYDSDEGTFYTLVRSNVEYCNYLTRALCRAIKENIYTRHNSTPVTGGSQANEANVGYVEKSANFTFNPPGQDPVLKSAFDGGPYYCTLIKSIISSSTVNPTSGAHHSRLTFWWQLDVSSIASTSTQPLNGYNMVLVNSMTYPGSTVLANAQASIPIFQNFGEGYNLSDLATIFPYGFTISSDGEIPFNGDALNLKPATSFATRPKFFLPNNMDIDNILMQYGEYNDLYLYGYYNNNANVTITGSGSLKWASSNDPCLRIGADAWKNQTYNDNPPPSVFPHFSFDIPSQRINFIANSGFVNQFNLYCSSGLLNAIGYDSVSATVPTSIMTGVNLTISDMLNTGCGFLQFPSQSNLSNQLSVVENFIEPQLSVFKRNFVYSILITSNNLSINGEYIGQGTKKLNILSDFEIDPSTNFRDYYIFQPEGNSVRYYDMNSDLPLNQVYLSVFYLDMNDNIKQLYIGAGTMGSVKLHFRPKSLGAPN